MTHQVLIARSLGKKLKAMRRAGKKGELAAIQCEALLSCIRNDGLLVDEVYRKRTKNGEYRISNCIKYDLGNGYRLVTIKDGQNLFVTFVGNHDETDLWLEHHKFDTYLPDDPAYLLEHTAADYQTRRTEPQSNECEEVSKNDPYEEQIMAQLDESIMKIVFHGLFSKQQT